MIDPTEEPENCRRQALAYLGRPEARFLLRSRAASISLRTRSQAAARLRLTQGAVDARDECNAVSMEATGSLRLEPVPLMQIPASSFDALLEFRPASGNPLDLDAADKFGPGSFLRNSAKPPGFKVRISD